ncbi:hypothetical protein JCM5353_006281 [Sporobolomyces roseus]
MSTSSSTSPLGDCVVCGTKTATRCGPCASHGTDWMYFCGTEHQKLIWKVHKRVCGNNSSPFKCPDLSEKEIQHFTRLSQQPFQTNAGTVATTTWWQSLESGLSPQSRACLSAIGLSPALAFEWTIRRVGKDSNGAALPIEQRTKDLQKLRRDSWHVENLIAHLATGASLKAVGLALLASNPFGYTAHFQQTLPVPKFTNDDVDYTDFWTRLQHRLLIRSCVYPLPTTVTLDKPVEGSYHAQRAIEDLISSMTPQVRNVAGEFFRSHPNA